MNDRIVLTGLAFFGYHGARPEEKRLGQRFLLDLELMLDLRPAGRTDDLGLTIDYGEAFRVAREVVEGPSRDTIEAVAEATARALMARYERLQAVTVRVHKPSAPIATAHVADVAVEITRRRGGVDGD